MLCWSQEEVFHGGDSYFDSLIEGLRTAKTSIDFEVYIFEDDALGSRIAEELCAAANRGVRVRVLVDGAGSPAWAPRFLPKLAASGVHGKVYHPFPWMFWSLSTLSSLWRKGFNRFLSLVLKVNRRDHRKVCIIDGLTAWVGSMNVSAWHLRAHSGEGAWRDTGARVSGEGVSELSAAFEKAWRKARGRGKGVQRVFMKLKKRSKGPFSPLVRLNDTRGKRKFYQRDFLQRMGRARRRIWITNAYFVPNRQILQSLRFVAGLGVDVRLLVPRKSDVFFMSWVVRVFYAELIGAGVRVFEYLPTVLHAKSMIVDDWALVGSTNLNYRSWLHDLEVDLVLCSEGSRVALEKQFLEDQSQSREITLEELTRFSWFGRWAGRLALLFRYWL